MVLLSGFQSDDYEDGTSVHSTNTAGVTHKIVQDGCELCAHLLIEKSCHTPLTFVHFSRAVVLNEHLLGMILVVQCMYGPPGFNVCVSVFTWGGS